LTFIDSETSTFQSSEKTHFLFLKQFLRLHKCNVNITVSFFAECSHIKGVEFSMYSDWLSAATANWQNNNFSHKQRGNCLSCPVTRINTQLQYMYLHICILYMDYGFYAERLLALCLTPRHLPFSQWCHIYSTITSRPLFSLNIPVW
jgi:hypothetical protein